MMKHDLQPWIERNPMREQAANCAVWAPKCALTSALLRDAAASASGDEAALSRQVFQRTVHVLAIGQCLEYLVASLPNLIAGLAIAARRSPSQSEAEGGDPGCRRRGVRRVRRQAILEVHLRAYADARAFSDSPLATRTSGRREAERMQVRVVTVEGHVE